jgi:NADPH:quinone reductase-like Zn-dependent oxidoreductase
MLAPYAVLNEKALVPMADHLSFEEAATLPLRGVIAWVALTGHRQVTAGDTVLTLGSGGVSVLALQFARQRPGTKHRCLGSLSRTHPRVVGSSN